MKRLLVLLLLFACSAGAGTKYRILRMTSDYDSMRVYWRTAGALVDSTVVTDFIDSAAIDDGYEYEFEFIWYIGSDTVNVAGDLWRYRSYMTVVAIDTTASGNVTLYAVDTSGTDVALEGVKQTITTAGGVTAAVARTNSSGYQSYFLDPATYTVGSRFPGYMFEEYTLTVTGDQTDTAAGYNTITTPSPPGGNLCSVYGTIYDREEVVEGAILTFTLPADVRNICDTTINLPITATATTDNAGLFSVDLVNSDCLSSSSSSSDVKYTAVIHYITQGGERVTKWPHYFVIPSDSTTYLLFY